MKNIIKFSEENKELYAELCVLDASQPIKYNEQNVIFGAKAFNNVIRNIFDFDINHNEITDLRGKILGFYNGQLYATVEYTGEKAEKAKELLELATQGFSITAEKAEGYQIDESTIFISDVVDIQKVAVVTEGFSPVSQNTNLNYLYCNFAEINKQNNKQLTNLTIGQMETDKKLDVAAVEELNIQLAELSKDKEANALRIAELEKEIAIKMAENALLEKFNNTVKDDNQPDTVKVNFSQSSEKKEVNINFAAGDPVTITDTGTEAKMLFIPKKDFGNALALLPNISQVPIDEIVPLKDGTLEIEGDFGVGTETTVIAGDAKEKFHPKFNGSVVGVGFFGGVVKLTVFDVVTKANVGLRKLLEGVQRSLIGSFWMWIMAMITGATRTITQFITDWSLTDFNTFLTPTRQNCYDFLRNLMGSLGYSNIILVVKQGALSGVETDLTKSLVLGGEANIVVLPASYFPVGKDFMLLPAEAVYGEISDSVYMFDVPSITNNIERVIEYLGTAFIPKEFANTVVLDTWANVEIVITQGQNP